MSKIGLKSGIPKLALSVVSVISIMVGGISLVGFMESVVTTRYSSFVVAGVLAGSFLIIKWGLT